MYTKLYMSILHIYEHVDELYIYFFFSFLLHVYKITKIKKIKDFLGFGAPTLKSYGCCYCMTSNHLLMVITSSTTCIHKNVIRFQNEIIQGLNDLIHVLQSTNSKV